MYHLFEVVVWSKSISAEEGLDYVSAEVLMEHHKLGPAQS